jgi:DNA-binding winged helix-turn-helix (wHTH) protein
MKSFKAFRLDTANHLLWRDGDRVPLTPKGFDVLAYLVENVGQVMTRDKILEALWPETYVNSEVLRKYIQEIRKALKDRPDKPEFIETLPKRGYRFVAPVMDASGVEPPDLATSTPTEEQATHEQATEATPEAEATVEAEATPLAVESPSGKRLLWKLAIVLVLVVVAAAVIGAYFIGIQAAAKEMKNSGRIVLIGSNTAIRTAFPGGSIYSMTKAALTALVRGAGIDLAPRAITVNNVQPGPAATDMSAPHADMVKMLIPLKRMGDVSEIAGLVSYLASEEAGFITGASLTIDGGYVA